MHRDRDAGDVEGYGSPRLLTRLPVRWAGTFAATIFGAMADDIFKGLRVTTESPGDNVFRGALVHTAPVGDNIFRGRLVATAPDGNKFVGQVVHNEEHPDGLYRGARVNGLYSGPIDAFSGSLYSAFGMRRLLASYTGPLIQVQRSSDNAEADIGYTVAGALDTAALLDFAEAGNAYVKTWYDQTGSARHAVQVTTAAQGRIVNAGVLDAGPNGGAQIVFSGAQFYEVQGALGFSRAASALTIAAIARATGAATQTVFTTQIAASNNARAGLYYTNATTAVFQGRQSDGLGLVTATKAVSSGAWARLVARARYAAGFLDLSLDGDAANTVALNQDTAHPTPDTDSFSLPRIGATGSGSSFLTGGMGAAFLFRSSEDMSALDAAMAGLMP